MGRVGARGGGRGVPAALGGPTRTLPDTQFVGEPGGLPSAYSVDTLATVLVALATGVAAELHATRCGKSLRAVTIDRARG